jgi:2-(1,2-epoxy-1,2-dihydrophenyl)acetyl-CoA isomerase
MSTDRVQLEIADGVALVTLDDPGALNAISPAMLDALHRALDAIASSSEGQSAVRCVMLTGAGRAFCAGANLGGADPAAALDENGEFDAGKPLDDQYHPLLRRLRDLHCPLLSVVNGVAAGAGMSLAMMGDLVLAARSAEFVQSFRHRGLVPDCGSTYLLPRLVGFGRGMELALLGEKIGAEQALDWGLVNRVYDDDALMDEARGLAAELAAGPTVAMRLIREAYWASRENGFEQQLALERELQRTAGRSKDFGEGVASFFQKRPPKFSGE